MGIKNLIKSIKKNPDEFMIFFNSTSSKIAEHVEQISEAYEIKLDELTDLVNKTNNPGLIEKHNNAIGMTNAAFQFYMDLSKDFHKSIMDELSSYKKSSDTFNDISKDIDNTKMKIDDEPTPEVKEFLSKLLINNIDNAIEGKELCYYSHKLTVIILLFSFEKTISLLKDIYLHKPMGDTITKTKEFSNYIACCSPVGPAISTIQMIIRLEQFNEIQLKTTDSYLTNLDNYIESLVLWCSIVEEYLSKEEKS